MVGRRIGGDLTTIEYIKHWKTLGEGCILLPNLSFKATVLAFVAKGGEPAWPLTVRGPAHVLQACRKRQKPWKCPSCQLLRILAVAEAAAEGSAGRRIRTCPYKDTSLSHHPSGSYTPRFIRLRWKVKYFFSQC